MAAGRAACEGWTARCRWKLSITLIVLRCRPVAATRHRQLTGLRWPAAPRGNRIVRRKYCPLRCRRHHTRTARRPGRPGSMLSSTARRRSRGTTPPRRRARSVPFSIPWQDKCATVAVRVAARRWGWGWRLRSHLCCRGRVPRRRPPRLRLLPSWTEPKGRSPCQASAAT